MYREGDSEDVEVWLNRIIKRQRAMTSLLAMNVYQLLEEPKPPSPCSCDLTISKREWEFLLKEWRQEVQRRYRDQRNRPTTGHSKGTADDCMPTEG